MTSGKRHGRLFGSVGSIFLLGALLLIDTLSADAADDFSSSALDIVDWIQGQEGGAFNSKQDIRLDAKQRRLGIFAKERIEEGEVLSQIPWGSIIAPKDDEDEEEVGIYEELDCDTVNLVLQEMNKVENEEGSEYGPYVKYLLEQIAVEPIPSVWSDNGKMLLVEILGGMEQQIPPGGAVDMIDTEWFLGCGADENDTFAEDVAGLVKKFAIYDVLVPLLDLYRHRNANYFNVRTELVRGVHYRVIANRTIEAGEQIYNSYDMCEECNPDAVDSGYGTPGKFILLVCFRPPAFSMLTILSLFLQRSFVIMDSLKICHNVGRFNQVPLTSMTAKIPGCTPRNKFNLSWWKDKTAVQWKRFGQISC